MSAPGQPRRFEGAPITSASHPTAAIRLRCNIRRSGPGSDICTATIHGDDLCLRGAFALTLSGQRTGSLRLDRARCKGLERLGQGLDIWGDARAKSVPLRDPARIIVGEPHLAGGVLVH